MKIKLINFETQFQNLYQLHLEFIDWAWQNFKLNYNIELISFDENYTLELEKRALHTIQDFESISPSKGLFYLIWDEETAIGMGGIKFLESRIAEIKRMYITPIYRGRGLGKQLLNQLIEDAIHLDFSLVRLDSMKFMTAAHKLYKSLGFKEREKYSSRIPDRLSFYYLYMELKL